MVLFHGAGCPVTPLEHLAFAEAALLTEPQTIASWSAIEHIRRARQQLAQPINPVRVVVEPPAPMG